MDFAEVIKKRRSIREYSDKPLPQEVLEKIVDSARFSPTARNAQPWEFIAVTRRPALRKLGELAENGKFLASAGSCIAVFCSDTKYYLEDGCAATCNILLAAASLGIGSCWVAGDKKDYCGEVAALLGVPEGYRLVSLVALGYPKTEKSFYAAEKKDLKKLLHWEKF